MEVWIASPHLDCLKRAAFLVDGALRRATGARTCVDTLAALDRIRLPHVVSVSGSYEEAFIKRLPDDASDRVRNRGIRAITQMRHIQRLHEERMRALLRSD
jgi:hypothetical protein